VSGYTGTGAGLTVKVHRVDTGAEVTSTTTTVGGEFLCYVADDTMELFAHVRQSSTLVGRSDNGFASYEIATGGPAGIQGED
jgi:hypothetical protein